MVRTPFAWVDGKPYLIVNFTLEPRDDLPPLRQLLDDLLEHHRPDDVLLLRPLSRAEAKLLNQRSGEAEVEAWATMVVKEDDRVRSRK